MTELEDSQSAQNADSMARSAAAMEQMADIMLHNQASASQGTLMLNALAANTAAATSGWIDVRRLEGSLEFIQAIGALTGSVAGRLQDAIDVIGTGAANIVPTDGAFTVIGTANNVQKRAVEAHSTRGFIRYIGTIVTGPAQISVVLLAHPKYVAGPSLVDIAVAPQSISATSVFSFIVVNWSTDAQNTSYLVFRSTVSGDLGSQIATTSTGTYSDTTAVPGTTYYYSVEGKNANSASAPSAQASALVPVLPLPDVPTNVVASPGAVNTIITWNAAANAVTYAVYRSTTNGVQGTVLSGATALTGLTFTDIAPTQGVNYFYGVIATNTVGSSALSIQDPSMIPVSVPSAPAAPGSVTATAGAVNIVVGWAASATATNYTVFRSTASGTLGAQFGSPTAALTVTDTTPTPGTAYWYSIKATNAGGTSAASAQATATVAPPALTFTVPAVSIQQGGTYPLVGFVAGGVPPYSTFAPASGSLETGVTISAAGVITVTQGAAVASLGNITVSAKDSLNTSVTSNSFSLTITAQVVAVFADTLILATAVAAGPNTNGGWFWIGIRNSTGDVYAGPYDSFDGSGKAIYTASAASPNNMPWSAAVRDVYTDAPYENTWPTADPVSDRLWIFGGGSSGASGTAYYDTHGAFAYWDWTARTLNFPLTAGPGTPPTPGYNVTGNLKITQGPYGSAMGYWNDALYYTGGFVNNVSGEVGKLILRPSLDPHVYELSITGTKPVLDSSDNIKYTMFRGGIDSRTGQFWVFDDHGELWILNHDGTTGYWSKIPTFGTRPPNATNNPGAFPSFAGSWCLHEAANSIVGYIGANVVGPEAGANLMHWYVLDLGTLVWRQSAVNASTITPGATSTTGTLHTVYDPVNQRAILVYNDQARGCRSIAAFTPAGPSL